MTARAVLPFPLTLLSLWIGCGVSLSADNSPVVLKPEKLNVGFTQTAFQGVNRLDAEAAFKTLSRTVGKNRGYDVTVNVHSYKTTAQFFAGLSAANLHVVVLDSWSYLEINRPDLLEPVFVASDHSQAAKRCLLLARDDGQIETLSDLGGKSLNVLLSSNFSLGTQWLRVVLAEHHLGVPEEFFGTIHYDASAYTTVLPVFFGQKDVALVDSSKFEVMAELNPQLRRLQVIASSEPLVNAVVCLRQSPWSSERFRKDMVEAMADLHLEPAGQQILALFRVGRFVPFDPSCLDTVRALRKAASSASNDTSCAPDRPVRGPSSREP